MTNKKRVYLFREGNATMRDLLGGKGANLAEMTNIGLPVPPGFTITTETCNEYTKLGHFPEGLWEEVLAALADVEKIWARSSVIHRTASCISKIGRKILHAWYDGHSP